MDNGKGVAVYFSCSAKSALKDMLEEAVFSEEGIQSRHYHLLAGDLRDMKALGDKILSKGIDTRLINMVPFRVEP